jgi:hypothetical protein
MDIPSLNQEIVASRQERAQALQESHRVSREVHERLNQVFDALERLTLPEDPVLQKAREEIRKLAEDFRVFEERVRIRQERFQKGLISVSIAGLEKAGKTTFLKSLTGIADLPAFDERCTAVACEIHYSEERSDFDLEFYSEAEFLERVVRPLVETIAASLPDPYPETFSPPTSGSGFPALTLPPAEAVPGGTTAFKLLNDLRLLQEHYSECRRNLGSPPLLHRPLSELREWVSYRRAEVDSDESDDRDDRGRHLARVAAVRVCRIYGRFQGGSAHLRWIDTPGVDDPNRRARDMTLATIARETDLLVVASRPGANPSPGESFHHFWDSVSRQSDEIDLMNRMLFVLNWDRRVDPEGENIKIHRKYLTDAGVPRHLFIGPYEAIQETDAAALMERVNEHLGRHLADQDDQVIQMLGARLKHLQARARLLHDTLAKSHPSDAGLQDQETDAFHRWFHWYAGARDTGFWTELVAALDRSTRDILEDDRIRESESALGAIFAEEAAAVQEQIPPAEALEEYVVKHLGENPIPNGMRTLSVFLSRLVNRLASEVQEFGPIMQDRLVRVFSEAGLDPLLEGETAGERLRRLYDQLAADRPAEASGSPVLEVLRETLDLPRNLKYVIRYELRAAVDFCDPTLWNEDAEAWNRLTDMVRANNGDTGRLAAFDTHRHPPVTDSREKDHAMLRKIGGNALFAVQSVLGNERYLPRRIADDFMRDCRVRLCFSPESEQEWRTLLYRCRGRLLAASMGRIRAESERIRAFRQSLRDLEVVLP